MKIGIIGFGSIGSRHYQNLKKFEEKVIVFTKRRDLDDIKSVSTWDDFKAEGPYTAILVTNETVKHLETISRCLELNPKAIFVEKPVSHNIDDIDKLAEKIKKSGISFWVGYNLHFFKPLIRIKEIINSGMLGKIHYLRVSVGQDLSEWRTRDYHLCYSSKKDQGGGVMLDLVHDINYPAWLLEAKLKVVNCMMKRISNLEIEVEDCVDSVFDTDSGTIVSVHQDYLRVPYKRSLEMEGSLSSLSWDTDSNMIKVFGKDKSILVSEEIVLERNEMYEKEIEFFIDSIKKNKFFSNLDEAIDDIKLVTELKKYANK